MTGLREEQLERMHCDLGVPWVASGAIAVIARGVGRFTSDINATIGGAKNGAVITAGDCGGTAAPIAATRGRR